MFVFCMDRGRFVEDPFGFGGYKGIPYSGRRYPAYSGCYPTAVASPTARTGLGVTDHQHSPHFNSGRYSNEDPLKGTNRMQQEDVTIRRASSPVKKNVRHIAVQDGNLRRSVQENESGNAPDLRRTEQSSKKPRKEISEVQAAIVIQARYRGYAVRRTKPLKHLQIIARVRGQLNKLRAQVSSTDLVEKVQVDSMARLKVTESIMALILQLDSIQGAHPSVREVRKMATKEAVELQEKVDEIVSPAPVSSIVEEDNDPCLDTMERNHSSNLCVVTAEANDSHNGEANLQISPMELDLIEPGSTKHLSEEISDEAEQISTLTTECDDLDTSSLQREEELPAVGESLRNCLVKGVNDLNNGSFEGDVKGAQVAVGPPAEVQNASALSVKLPSVNAHDDLKGLENSIENFETCAVLEESSGRGIIEIACARGFESENSECNPCILMCADGNDQESSESDGRKESTKATDLSFAAGPEESPSSDNRVTDGPQEFLSGDSVVNQERVDDAFTSVSVHATPVLDTEENETGCTDLEDPSLDETGTVLEGGSPVSDEQSARVLKLQEENLTSTSLLFEVMKLNQLQASYAGS